MSANTDRRRVASALAHIERGPHLLPWAPLNNAYSAVALVVPWLLFTILVGLTMRGQIAALAIDDPDDAMRILEVRDWLAGQSWWDVTNYRAGGSGGLAMHWSRLVDLPLAALTLLFGTLLPFSQAEIASAALIPPLQLLAALFILRGTLRCLGFRNAAANIVLLIVPMLSLVIGNMVPLKVDHHGWQIICALGILRLMADRRNVRHKALFAGLTGAVLLAISIEGLPLIATVCGIYALFYMREENDRGLAPFLGGLALGSIALFVATRPVPEWGHAWPDAISWPHLVGFLLSGIVAVLALRMRQTPPPIMQAAILLGIAVAGAAPVLLTFGLTGIAPFSAIDPLVREYWLGGIQEVKPIYEQQPEKLAVLGWMSGLYVLALVTQARKLIVGEAAFGWFTVFALSGAMLVLALVFFRVALFAQLLMAPLFAAMLHDVLRSAARINSAIIRVVGITLALILLSPAGGSLAGKALAASSGAEARGPSKGIASNCDLRRLTALPKGRVLTPIDIGALVLLRTEHSIVAAGYHRNQAALAQALRAFTGPVSQAHDDVVSSGADYVVVCRGTPNMARYASASPDSFAAALLEGYRSDWLQPVPGFETGGLSVWSVSKRNGLDRASP